MILDSLQNADRYSGFYPGFERAFAFLRGLKPDRLAPGRHEIDGERLYGIIGRFAGRGEKGARLEVNREYVDIQCVMSGADRIGWKALRKCRKKRGRYDSGKDIQFLGDVPDTWVDISAGSFAVFFPEDAHAPLAMEGKVDKVVVKAAVSCLRIRG